MDYYLQVSKTEQWEQQQHHKYQQSHRDFPHKNPYTFISVAGIKDTQTFQNPNSSIYSGQMD